MSFFKLAENSLNHDIGQSITKHDDDGGMVYYEREIISQFIANRTMLQRGGIEGRER